MDLPYENWRVVNNFVLNYKLEGRTQWSFQYGVVEARARKMGVEAVHGVALHDKGRTMREIIERKSLKAENVIFIGNDINDLPCFEVAGWSVAVADAFPDVIRAADHVLTKAGGHGALREMCDLILNRTNKP